MKNKIIEKPKNDVIYVRVSSKEQVTNFSLDSQEKTIRDFSQRSGYEIFHVFREEGESAKTADRTELQKLLRFCEINKKQISRVVVYKVDRFSRFTTDYLALKACLNNLHITLVSATESFDNSPAGKLNETMLSAFAQFDNDVKSQRTIEGMKARLLKGLWSGVAPWGYINTRDATDSKIIAPHPERAPIVKMIFEKYATGKYTFLELAKLINKMGIKSRHGVKMSKQSVAQIIKNPIFYGRMVVLKFGIDTMGSHEPIISKELFDEANLGKKGKDRKLPRNRDSPDYPLRGIKCGGCGKSITGGRTRSKTGRYYQYYGCICGECEKRTAIKKDDLENDFTKFLLELTPNNEYLDVLKEAIKLAHKSELNSVINEERKINGRITELKDKKEKLLDLRIAGKISDEDFTPTNEKLKLQISGWEIELSKLSSPELEIEIVVDSGIEFIKNFSYTWKDLDVKDLRVLRNLFFPSNLTYNYPTIKTPEVCCVYNIKPELSDMKKCLVPPAGIEPAITA